MEIPNSLQRSTQERNENYLDIIFEFVTKLIYEMLIIAFFAFPNKMLSFENIHNYILKRFKKDPSVIEKESLKSALELELYKNENESFFKW